MILQVYSKFRTVWNDTVRLEPAFFLYLKWSLNSRSIEKHVYCSLYVLEVFHHVSTRDLAWIWANFVIFPGQFPPPLPTSGFLSQLLHSASMIDVVTMYIVLFT